jgi:hypothetical protein
MYTFTSPELSWLFFLIEKRKRRKLPLMTKKEVYTSPCVQALDGVVFRFALQAHYLSGNSFRFILLKIGWVDARARLIAVW